MTIVSITNQTEQERTENVLPIFSVLLMEPEKYSHVELSPSQTPQMSLLDVEFNRPSHPILCKILLRLTEPMTYCCLGRKHQNLVLFWKIFNSYIYVSVDKDTINNSERYFTCGVCNLENIAKNL